MPDNINPQMFLPGYLITGLDGEAPAPIVRALIVSDMCALAADWSMLLLYGRGAGGLQAQFYKCPTHSPTSPLATAVTFRVGAVIDPAVVLRLQQFTGFVGAPDELARLVLLYCPTS